MAFYGHNNKSFIFNLFPFVYALQVIHTLDLTHLVGEVLPSQARVQALVEHYAGRDISVGTETRE